MFDDFKDNDVDGEPSYLQNASPLDRLMLAVVLLYG